MEEAGEWVSVSEAARRLGISRPTVGVWLKRGKLKGRSDNRGNPQVFAPEGMKGQQPQPPAPAQVLAIANGASVPPAEAVAIQALRDAIQAMSADHHRALAAERRRGDLLAAELARPFTVLERLIGRRIVQAPAGA